MHFGCFCGKISPIKNINMNKLKSKTAGYILSAGIFFIFVISFFLHHKIQKNPWWDDISLSGWGIILSGVILLLYALFNKDKKKEKELKEINEWLKGGSGIIILFLFSLPSSAQDSGDYCRSSAVEEKLEISAYYPIAFSYIGQFWDTSHNFYNFRTRQNVWIEPKDTVGFGFISTDFAFKKIPVYLSAQARFNSHTSIWLGFNTVFSDFDLVKNIFYQAQIGVYKNLHTKDCLINAYAQSKPILNEKVFFEGFLNYYPKENEYSFEVESGIKINHTLALMLGFDHVEKENHFFGGLRFEMYERKNQRR